MHIGLLGAGRIGAFHARALAHNGLVDGLSIADADVNRAATLAGELNAQCRPTPEDVVAGGVDGLVIAAPTPAHAALIHLAADAGLPVFCEKPIALDLETTDAVLDHVAKAGLLLQIGFQRRFDPGYRAARQEVHSGRIGDLLLVRAATHDPEPPPEEYLAGSGGIWRDLMIHDFDVLPWVTGRQIVEVYADGSAGGELFGRYNDLDRAAALLRFDSGALGIVSGGRYDPLGYDVRLELLGSRDSIAVGMDDRIALRSVEPGVAPPRGGHRDFMERFESAYRAELQTFLEAVRDRGESACSGEDARRALCVALAAERSCRERRPVRVEEIG
ncbi:MAG TPA: Gfo/Idh/MocA family oxidoreductase [Candidatus Dormibacteraeota bacterium]|nr:Gfo/Idh/MocA family oxidoreductase [Candidatus Dormibacteraeota bacterium]